MHIHETLVKYDVDMNLVPCLAESWEVSEDLLRWAFRLRKGVKFHDGTPFNAEAVKYTFERMLDPMVASPRKGSVAMVKEVKVLNEHTVAFIMGKPFAPFLNQLTSYNLAIISPTAARKLGKRYGQYPAGTGPFKLDSWVRDKIILARNPSYWERSPRVDRLAFRVVPEDSARATLLLSGEADVISPVPVSLMDKLTQSKDIRMIREKGFRTIYIGLNNKIKPFDDLRVRRAVAHAINKEAILKEVLKGIGTLGGSLESPAIPGAYNDLKPYAYDPARAKRLLEEAGFPNGFNTTFYTPTGRYTMDRQVAEAIKAQLKDVGIHVTIEAPDWAKLTSLFEKGTEDPMFLMGKGSPTGDLDLTLHLTVKTGGKMNYFQYSNSRVDKLIAEQQGMVDPQKRFQVLHEIQKIVYEECPAVVLFYEDQVFGRRANVHGIEVYPYEFIGFGRALKR